MSIIRSDQNVDVSDLHPRRCADPGRVEHLEDMLSLLSLASTDPNREDVANLLHRFHRRCAESGLPELERLVTTVLPGW